MNTAADREVLCTSTVDIGTLVKETGLSMGQVQAALAGLQGKGYLRQGREVNEWILTAPNQRGLP